jgi:hypothetical protein
MKPFRLLLIGAAVLVALLVAVVVVAFSSRFQTWAARRALAARPELHATLGSVSAGLGRVEITGLRLELRGAVLTLPAFSADLPLLSAGFRNKLLITRLAAKGWTLDLTKAQVPVALAAATVSSPVVRDFSFLSAAYAADPVAATAATGKLFQGVFAQLQLPVDLALEGVDVAGDIILPAISGRPPGRLRVTLTGGGLASGRTGKFALALDAEAGATGVTVDSLAVQATLVAAMDTPRTFARLGAKADATATGPKFPRGVKLTADVAATRSGPGENYALTLATGDKLLLGAQAAYPNGVNRLDGTWKLDVRDADLAPFALGRALPVFEATGEGRFDADTAFTDVHAAGKLAASAQDLTVVRAELAAMGAVRFAADFDLTHHGDTTRVERVNVTLSGAQPVATVQSLQAFEFNARTGELQKVADPARELFSVVLLGVPLAWAQPFAGNLTLAGGDLRGEFAATARNGGFAVRAKVPLTAARMSVDRAGNPLLRAVDFVVNASADYTPQGWQVEVAPLAAQSGGITLLSLDAKAGQLAGKDQPIKAAGTFSADLPALLAQPVASGKMVLIRGEATGEFAASVDAKQAVQIKIALKNLATDPKLSAEKFPAVSADLRADITADGKIALSAPLLIERDGRKSDLTVDGILTPSKEGFAIDARVTSTLLVVDDAKIIGAALAPSPTPTVSTAPAMSAVPDVGPPWAGVSGQLALALKQVIYSDTFKASDVTGTLRLDAGTFKFDGVRAGLDDGAEAKFTGGVTFDAKSVAPYALAADVAVTDFDPAPLFKGLNPGQLAPVEGKFTVTTKLTGTAVHPADFATATHGDFQLTSKGGIFRGLPVNVATKTERLGKIAAGVGFVGSAFDVFKGRKDDSDITSLAKAVAEVAKMLAAISYDQLSVVLTRDAMGNTVLKDFTLIAPEMRITGAGQAVPKPGGALLDETLAMEFKLRARGHTGDLLKFLGKLETQTDELGYAACTLPLKVGGTLGKPDTSELNNALAGLALEKSGVLDKAGDLLNRLIPGGK